MKIAGKELTNHNRDILTLCRGGEKVELVVMAVPPGFDELQEVRGLATAPTPPLRVVRQGYGKGQIVKGPDGKALQERDLKDPEWVAEFSRWQQRMNAVTLAAVLRESDAAFDAVPPTSDDASAWAEYADALAKEINDPDSGFTSKEIRAILDAAEKLACKLDVEGQLNSFLDHQD